MQAKLPVSWRFSGLGPNLHPRCLPMTAVAPSRLQLPAIAAAAAACVGRKRREALVASVVLLGPKVAEAKTSERKAPEVVRELWGKGLRTGEDLSQWSQLLAEDCIYEDLYYAEATKGKQEVMKLIGQKLLPANSQLMVDDISDGQSSCGFTWHVEQQGVGIGQRGLCYVRLNSAGEVAYVRDLGEPLSLDSPSEHLKRHKHTQTGVCFGLRKECPWNAEPTNTAMHLNSGK